MEFDIKSYGAVGDGKTLNTKAIQKAIDECNAKGGGMVVVSGGRYLTGKIILKSNVDLHITADGVLLGSADCADFPESTDAEASHVNSEMLARWNNACMIFANECENISISGAGVIDCNGHNFVEPRTDGGKGWPYRRIDAPTPPRVVFFTGCRNIRVSDVTMTNQPAGWSYWIHDCDYVNFTRVRIIAEVLYPNNDGIHINCSRNVTVSDSFITCGDDCIVVRANSVSLKENKVCEKVTVTNCNLTSYSAGIRIGWTNDGVIRNCAFSNIVMTDTSVGISIMMPNGVRSKENLGSNRTGSSDIGREETVVENLTFSNIIMDKVLDAPIKIMPHDTENVHVKFIGNLYFNNIHTSGPEFPLICGTEKVHLKNLFFSDCTFNVTDGSEFPNRDTHGAGARGLYDGNKHIMSINHAENVVFSNTSFTVN